MTVDNPVVHWNTNVISIERKDGSKWKLHPCISAKEKRTADFKRFSSKNGKSRPLERKLMNFLQSELYSIQEACMFLIISS